MKDALAMEAGTHLQHNSNDIFLIDNKTAHTYTYQAFFESASKIGQFFLSAGLTPGDRLIIMMDNSIVLAKIYFACLYAGITVVPVNPGWTSEQVGFVLTDSQAKFALTASQYQHKLSAHDLTLISVAADETVEVTKNNKTRQFESIEHTALINAANFLKPENIAIIIYTSGTTSNPKGVIHTVSDLVGNGLLFIKTMNMTPKNRFYNILPMTYLGGYYNLLLIPYLAKASVVIANAFSTQTILQFWNEVSKHQINTLWLVPTMMAILMEIDRSTVGSTYCKQNIILALAGTAPLASRLKTDFEKKYAISVYENYGLSETLFISTQLPGKSSGVGKILNNVSLKILDNHEKEVAVGEEGEIVVATPYAMTSYLGIQNSFNKSQDKWFFTGDLGHIDADGCLQISGRKKDLIIKGGINISPAAIEEVFYRHPAMQECAIVGIPHPLSGEEIIAVVKIKENEPFDVIKKQLLEYCKESLSTVQMPVDIVQLDELPHTYTGKIQKAKLRNWLVENKNNKNAVTKVELAKDTYFYKPSNVTANCIEALSIAYNTRVYELQSQNVDVTVLSLGEAFFDIPLFDFTSLPYPSSYHYSHSRGVPKLREVLAEYFLNQYDVKFNPNKEIIVTAGSKIAIYMVLMALVNPGDEVIIHDPAWVSYPEQVKLCHGIPVQVPYHETVYDFEKYITNRTKVLIVNNPNNPRGSVLTLDEIAHLYKLAEKYKLYILSDEAYSDFVVNKEQFISIGNFDKELKFSIICNSISKNFGISGWRIGYVIANQYLIDQILKLNQHLITCPATILENYIAKNYYEILKYTKPQIAELMVKRSKVIDHMRSLGLTALDGDTTFYLFLSIAGTRLTSDEFCTRLLNEHAICVVPGIGYGKSCDQFVRVSIGAEPLERIFSALEKIKLLIEQTKPNAKHNLQNNRAQTPALA